MKKFYTNLEYALSNIKQVKHKMPLTSRINKNETLLFDLQHLQLKESHPLINDVIDLDESLDKLLNVILQ